MTETSVKRDQNVRIEITVEDGPSLCTSLLKVILLDLNYEFVKKYDILNNLLKNLRFYYPPDI